MRDLIIARIRALASHEETELNDASDGYASRFDELNTLTDVELIDAFEAVVVYFS